MLHELWDRFTTKGRVFLYTSSSSLPPLSSPSPSLAPHLCPDVQRIMRNPLRSVQPRINLVNLPVALLDQLDHAHLCVCVGGGAERGGVSQDEDRASRVFFCAERSQR